MRLNKLLFSILPQVQLLTDHPYSGEFPFTPEAWTMEKYPERREIRAIRISGRIISRRAPDKEHLKKPGEKPGNVAGESLTYHKHFKRLVKNL